VLAILLHAHLPFVRHPEHAHFLEEDWLFEAITESYLPLTSMLYRLAEEGVPFRIAMTVTPTLGAMLRDPLLLARYDAYLERLIAFAESEARRLRGAGAEAARFALLRLFQVREWWSEIGRDIPGALAGLQQHGLELVACAATHGFLPLMALRSSVKAQIAHGVAAHRSRATLCGIPCSCRPAWRHSGVIANRRGRSGMRRMVFQVMRTTVNSTAMPVGMRRWSRRDRFFRTECGNSPG